MVTVTSTRDAYISCMLHSARQARDAPIKRNARGHVLHIIVAGQQVTVSYSITMLAWVRLGRVGFHEIDFGYTRLVWVGSCSSAIKSGVTIVFSIKDTLPENT